MRRLIWMLAALWLIMVPAQVWAESMYVTDEFRITMRTGPGTDHKIITMLKSGQQVDVVMTSDEWSLVGTPNGTEGWVLTRFLTTTPPSRQELSDLKLKQAQASPSKQNKRIKEADGAGQLDHCEKRHLYHFHDRNRH